MLLAFSIGWLFVPVAPEIEALIRLVTVIACGFALWRYIQLYRRSSIHLSPAFLAALALLGEATTIQQIAAPVYNLSFWLSHAAGIAALALMAYAAFFEVRD